MGGMETLQGQLLIASPALLDPNFRRTVVLVTEHNDEGAAGLVLNRPSPAEVAELVPQLEPLVEDGEPVWLGGPVQQDAVLVLGEFVDPDDAAVPLFGALGFPSLEAPDEVVPATTRRRVFAGYAGWGAGQLEDELAREDWIVEPALRRRRLHRDARRALVGRPAPQGRRLRARRADPRGSVRQLTRTEGEVELRHVGQLERRADVVRERPYLPLDPLARLP